MEGTPDSLPLPKAHSLLGHIQAHEKVGTKMPLPPSTLVCHSLKHHPTARTVLDLWPARITLVLRGSITCDIRSAKIPQLAHSTNIIQEV